MYGDPYTISLDPVVVTVKKKQKKKKRRAEMRNPEIYRKPGSQLTKQRQINLPLPETKLTASYYRATEKQQLLLI